MAATAASSEAISQKDGRETQEMADGNGEGGCMHGDDIEEEERG